MNEVMLTAENYEELQAIILARRFYLHKNDEKKYSIEDIDTLYKRFSKGFAAMRNEKEIHEFIESVKDYRQEIRGLGISDHHVAQY